MQSLPWLHLVYGHDNERPRPALAARMLAEQPDLGNGGLFLACATGNETAVREAVLEDPSCLNRVDNPLAMPPLVAITHSGLLQLPELPARCGAAPGCCWTPGRIRISPGIHRAAPR